MTLIAVVADVDKSNPVSSSTLHVAIATVVVVDVVSSYDCGRLMIPNICKELWGLNFCWFGCCCDDDE